MASTAIFSLSLPAAASLATKSNLPKPLFPASWFHPTPCISSSRSLLGQGNPSLVNYLIAAKGSKALTCRSLQPFCVSAALHSASALAVECPLQPETLPRKQEIGIGAKFLRSVLLSAPICCSLLLLLDCRAAFAAAAASDSIRASGIGLKIATWLRGTGWPDEAIVFALATLPVLELRGAIPVGYWMQLDPRLLTALSILGNMVPVPFIILYLKKLASLASQNSASAAARLLDFLLQRARDKAEPVREFQWLGLMLFVAVPFPGTGAWTGAIVASVLDMPFWSAVSANFVGVALAAILVNLLVNLGLKQACVVGLGLFLASTFMWTALRQLKRALPNSE